MTLSNAEPKNILDTSSKAALSAWDRLLEIQVELFLPYEINYYLSNPAWQRAKYVLDAGCGNGYYISRVQSFFPQKSYTGIDISGEMSAIANSRFADAGIAFEQADFLEYQPQTYFDVIVMRLIVQHMSGFQEILAHASELLSAQNSLIIIEPDMEGFLNIPETPLFTRLLKEYGEYTEKTRRNRALLPQLDRLVEDVPDWHVVGQKLVAVPRIGPLTNTKFLQMFHLWIDIFERSNVLQFPFSKARDELDEWSNNDTAYSQIGFRVIELSHTKSD
jgi:SAM-dependent methyltransferase